MGGSSHEAWDSYVKSQGSTNGSTGTQCWHDGSGRQRSGRRIQDAPTVALISWKPGQGVVDLWVPFAQLLISNVDTVRDAFGNAAAAAKER